MRGIWLVTAQEFRIRLQTGRWPWLLLGWLVLVSGFTFLVDLNVETGFVRSPDDSLRGVPLFGLVMLFVLGMMLVISPALTAQTINGDRERGTLATLQVTRLRPIEIALGKLLAGWAVGLAALALTLPAVGYAFARGGLPIARVAACYAVVALLIGVICAISQAYSALLARSLTSLLLAYLTVMGLAVGTVIAFSLAQTFVEEKVTVTPPPGQGSPYTYERVRIDRIWWLVAPNPFAIVADAAPAVPPRVTQQGDVIRVEHYDPLSEIGRTVRNMREPNYYDYYSYDGQQRPEPPPVWPWGLGFNLLLGVGSVVVTTLRLRTPTRSLARGVRLA